VEINLATTELISNGRADGQTVEQNCFTRCSSTRTLLYVRNDSEMSLVKPAETNH